MSIVLRCVSTLVDLKIAQKFLMEWIKSPWCILLVNINQIT